LVSFAAVWLPNVGYLQGYPLELIV
jgi:hypothetical protein